MTYAPTLSEWNWHVLMLNQALIGSVSNNFRMVVLKWEDDFWLVEFFIFEESTEDREEISEIIDSMSVYVMDLIEVLSDRCRVEIRFDVTVTDSEVLANDDSLSRVVFKRKEQTTSD